MKTKKALFYILAGILGGCVPVMSLHPLYTEQDVVFEEKLLGTWVDDANDPETVWEFKVADKEQKKCNLIFTGEEGKKGLFDVYSTKIGGKLFLDIFPSEPPWDEKDPNNVNWVYNTPFLVPVHSFIKVDSIEGQLKLQLTDDDDFKKLLGENSNAVEYAIINELPVLTAPTNELQAFVLKYADDERLFANEVNLIRKKVCIEPNKPSEK